MSKIIPMSELEDGRIYRIHSRNLITGAWRAETGGFIGIRQKFGSEYLFEEYLAERGGPHGTARPIQALGEVVPPAQLDEDSDLLFDLLKRVDAPIIEQMWREEREARLEAESKRWAPQTRAQFDREQRVAAVRAEHGARVAEIALIEDEAQRTEAQKEAHRRWVEDLTIAIKGDDDGSQ